MDGDDAMRAHYADLPVPSSLSRRSPRHFRCVRPGGVRAIAGPSDQRSPKVRLRRVVAGLPEVFLADGRDVSTCSSEIQSVRLLSAWLRAQPCPSVRATAAVLV